MWSNCAPERFDNIDPTNHSAPEVPTLTNTIKSNFIITANFYFHVKDINNKYALNIPQLHL